MNARIAAQIDAICDSLEDSWKKGTPPDLARMLSSAPEEMRIPLAQQMVLVDAECRRKIHGVAPSHGEYAAMLSIDAKFLMNEPTIIPDSGSSGDTQTVIGKKPGETDFSPSDWDAFESYSPPVTGPQFLIRGYCDLQELGRGGMGVVYKARQLRPERVVAIKTIHSPHLAGHELVQRFRAEADAAGRLDHRGIVPVFEVGEDNGVHFFSMGFVEGTDLEKKARRQILSCAEAAEICRDVADALEYAHQNDVVHRDIKPQNILIGTDGKPRITDFGLAKITNRSSELTGSGQIMGTAAYMPPEQATGNTADAGPAADIYALGATLYRCITGRPPFQAASQIEILRQVVEDEPVHPRRLNREIDADIETLCLKCLEKQPAQRFCSAAEFSAELTRYLNHEPILSRPIGKLERGWRWCRRRPFVAVSAALAVSLILAVTTGLPYLMWLRSEQQVKDLKLQQTEQLAATNQYWATVRQAREHFVTREPGWTWKALDLLQRAAESPAAGKDVVELRSLLADAVTAPDTRLVYQLDGLREAGSIAVSGDGRWLALGDRKGVPTSDLRIYEVHTSGTESNGEDVSLTLRYTCSLFTGGIKAKSELNRLMKGLGFAGTRIENEGLHAATFSPDAGRVAVITRNGRVVSWKLDGESPASLFDTPTGEDSVNNAGRILYSPDGRTIYANWADARTGRIVRIIDAETGEIRQEMRESTWDIGLLNDGRLLLSQDPAVERIGADESTDRVSLPKRDGTTLANIDVCADRPLMFLNSGTLATVDPITGLYGVDFESRGTSPRRVCFTSDSGIVCGECGPEFLRLWDALSGKWIQDVSFPGEEVPKIAVHSERNRIFVASHQSLKVFAVRGTEHLSIAGQADSKAASSGTVNDQKLSANTPMVSRQALISAPGILPAQTESHTAAINSPRQGDVLPRLPEFNDAVVNVFAPGSDIVTAIDLSGDGNTLAVLEQPAGNSGDRTRVRKMDTIRGAEIERWTCAATEASTVAVTGSDIAFTGNGNRITVAAGIPGNLILLTENGFDIPSGAGLDVPRNPPVSAEGKSATWSPFPEIALERKFQVAVAVYFPRALFQSKEYLEFELSSSNRISKYRADDRIVDSKGWYLLMLGNVASETLSNDWSLKLTLTADGLSMATASTEVGASGSVVAGDAYAFPTRGVDGKRKTVGPVSGRGDNGIVGAVENFLFQWNPGESLPTGSPWMDLVNNQEDIRSISSARSCTLVGSNSGLVGILNADNSFKNLQDGFKASVDSRDGCTATAITPDARFGFVGTRGGQLRVYNLTSEQNRPAFEVAAHSRGITALAVTDDGEIVSSADDNGKLRFWRRVDDTLELLFEMTRDSSPIVDLRFGPEGHFLYLLRKNERGIRRIDLKRLIDLYGIYGLSE